MGARFGSLAIVPWILFAQMSWEMSAVPVTTVSPASSEVTAEIHDRGGMFSRDVSRRAREALRQILRDHRMPVFIETIESLGGEAIDESAQRRARQRGGNGIYVLLAGRERDAAVVFDRLKTGARLTEPDRAALREAFLGPLRAGEPDSGLERGVRAIGTTLAHAVAAKRRSARADALISAAALLGVLAVLIVTRARSSQRGRRRRRRALPLPRTQWLDRSRGHAPDDRGCSRTDPMRPLTPIAIAAASQ